MASPREQLLALLRGLNLGAMASAVEDTALRAAKEGLSHEAFLLELARPEQAAPSAHGGSRACATNLVCCRGRTSARSISIASLRPPGCKSSACATATSSPRPSMSSPLVDPAPGRAIWSLPDMEAAPVLVLPPVSLKSVGHYSKEPNGLSPPVQYRHRKVSRRPEADLGLPTSTPPSSASSRRCFTRPRGPRRNEVGVTPRYG